MDDDRRRILAGIGIACAAAGCLGIGDGSGEKTERDGPDPSGPWPSFGRTNANAATTPGRRLSADPGVTWTYRKPAAAVTAQPVVGSGTVVAGSHDGHVYCAEAATGAHRWVLGNVNSPISDYPILDAGVLGPERAFVPTSDGHITAFDLANGQKPWVSRRIGGDTLVYTAPVLRDGTLYAGSGAANLYALGTDGGDRLATYDTARPVLHPLALGDGALVAATYDAVHAFDPDGGRRWRVGTNPTGAPAIAGGRAYVPAATSEGDGGRLRALDLDTGEAAWTARVPNEAASPAVAGDRIYVAGAGAVVALDASGAERWRTEIGTSGAPPALAAETVVIACADGTLRGLHADDGSERWRVAVGGTLTAPAVGEERILVGSADGFLAAVG